VPLTEELLDRLERCISDQQLPWLAHRHPALSQDEISALTEPLGIRLSPELRLWWTWFNGARSPRRVELTPVFQVLSLKGSLQFRDTMRVVAAQVAGPRDEDVDKLRPPSMLPMFGTGGSPVIAADSARAPASSLHYLDFHPTSHDLLMVAPSLGDAVHRWVEMYAAGLYRWDTHAGVWDVPRDIAQQPIITLLI
jgi:hypothetical protein